MLRKFARRTGAGAIRTSTAEHYLRADVGCGVETCRKCAGLGEAPLRSERLLIPDTNVALHQLDLLEALEDVVVLQTVLLETRHRSPAIHARLRALVAAPDRRWLALPNEHMQGLFVNRRAGESINDRNDRAIRRACQWYAEGCASASVVLLTDDAANRKIANEMGLTSFAVREFARDVLRSPELQDKVALAEADSTDQHLETASTFAPHLSPTELAAGLTAGRFVKGKFSRSRDSLGEGYVTVRSMDHRVLVRGVDMNRAVHGDVVAVEVFDQTKWVAPSEVVDVNGGARQLSSGHGDDDGEAGITAAAAATPTGRVVGVVKRGWRPYCGALLPRTSADPGRRALFAPTDRLIPAVRINTRQAAVLEGNRIVVAIDSWPADSKHPLGHYVRTIGKIGDPEVEAEVVLVEHQIPYQPFQKAVLDEMPSLPWTVPPAELARRRDLRGLNVCSIDPPGCTDIDDALHVRPLSNGNFEVGIHIADVSHFVRPGSACDAEAARRGTTVYLANRRIDMVPPVLSGNICSLRSGVERLAFSTLLELTPEADVSSVNFCKSVIKSKHSFMYSEAQAVIDDVDDKSETAEGLRVLNRLAKRLKRRRLERGALMLASPEVRFNIESETADPVGLEAKAALDTNSLVEEFMLLANVTTATETYKHFPECAMLRRHPAPPGSNFEPLIKAASAAGVKLDCSSSKKLAVSLDSSGDAGFLLRILATRCMLPAEYFASGTVAQAEFKHYGLAATLYTHFTSPIRRYSDIIVHRLLAAVIGADSTYPDLVSKSKAESISTVLNVRHACAQRASRASTEVMQCVYLRGKTVDVQAFVMGVKQNGVRVLVPAYGLEGFVRIDDAVYDADALTISRASVQLKMFQPILVQISTVDSTTGVGYIDIKLVEPVIASVSVLPSDVSRAKKSRI